MRPRFIVIAHVGSKDPMQVCLAQGDDMIDALATDRPDQSFGEAVLPRRACGNRLVSDGHGPQPVFDDVPVDPVTIADQVSRSLIPRERLRDLACNPLRGWVCGDVDPDKVSAFQPDDDQGIEKVEADGWHKAHGCARR